MSVNVAGELRRWAQTAIRIEKQLKIEDIRLVKLGFTLADVQSMTLIERRHYLELGADLQIIDEHKFLFGMADVGIVANGFSSKTARKKIIKEWKTNVSGSMQSLTGESLPDTRRSTRSRRKPKPSESFRDRLAKLGDKKKVANG